VTDSLDPALRAALSRIAHVPYLLVICDYDGTLAPIVDDPSKAGPLPEAVAAVRSLCKMPQTTVAVVSGRALRDLAALSRLPSDVHLVGSHGSEFDIGFVQHLDEEKVELRARMLAALEDIAQHHAGVRLETKPASVALHTRRAASPEIGAAAVAAVRSGPATWPGITATAGKEVIELSVISTHKGTAVDILRTQFGASAVLFIGDDVTDENAFGHLRGPDVGIKIGPGETKARYRVEDPEEGVRSLALLLETRRRWLFGDRAVPIENHSMLANGRTLALVTPTARVTWLCHPYPESSAIFADLLGGTSAGHFSVSPARDGQLPLSQRYRPGTMTLETRWSGLTVTDALLETAGRDTLVRVLTGTAKVAVEFAPRPEFGQVQVSLQALGDGLLVVGSNQPAALHSPGVEWNVVVDGHHPIARAELDLAAAGGQLVLELRMGSDDVSSPASADLGAAETASQDWLARLNLPLLARDEVERSALVLRALCHEPTGAILASATTSLPEVLGGVRNWDYRYCWLRDAAMTARALVDLGALDEAAAFVRWVDARIADTDGHPERLHPLYAVDGHDLGPEAVVDTLPGYAGSRPVRVGNAAHRQLQLDVFGPIADLIAAIAEARGGLADEEWRVLSAVVTAVERRWHEPDHGLWEARIPPRHNVYSKVMCWLAVDRALRVASEHRGELPAGWASLRDRIGTHVLSHGWNESVEAFTVAYGEDEMDASALWVGLSGLLANDDPRFVATVRRVEADLRGGAVVYRYRWDDGLPGTEGGFHICTAWLIEAYLRTGRRADAEELFTQMLGTAGPTGLLPEQYDPLAERGLGNLPQAYSHLGLIRSALLLDGEVKD
jgi:trehalose-phosphatase